MKQIGSDSFWKTGGGLIGLIALLVMIVAVNVILNNVRIRKDLTQEKLYTLTQGTKNILGRIDNNVTLKLFFSSSVPEVSVQFKNYAKRIEDLLEEYRTLSRGKISIEKYDPKPDSDAEEWAQRYGLDGQQVGMFTPPVYFGLVATCGKNEAAITTFDPRAEAMLEYQITQLIYRTAHPEKPVLGIISSLPVMGMNTQFAFPQQPPVPAWTAFQQLKEDYTVTQIPQTAEEIQKDISTLIIVHPKSLSDKLLYAIDQFILRGGRVLAFVDPVCVAELEITPAQQQFGRTDSSSNMEKLFSAWGVTFTQDKIIADMALASRVRTQKGVEENSLWLTLRPENLSRKDIVTTQLGMMALPFAGSFSINPQADMTVAPLICSSDSAGLINSLMAQMGSSSINRNFKKEPRPLNIAIRLTGTFKTAFPAGKPAGDEAKPGEEKKADKPAGKEAAPAGLKEGRSTVALVGDVDMIFDRFCIEQGEFMGLKTMQVINDNLSFFANVVEQITGSEDLIGIRSRGRFQRPFTRVLDLEKKAREAGQSKEEALMARIRDIQEQMSRLQASKDKNQRFALNSQQKRALNELRDEQQKFNNELKTLRKNLRSDIENLGIKVKVINIAMMPLVVALAGITYGFYRRRKRQP